MSGKLHVITGNLAFGDGVITWSPMLDERIYAIFTRDAWHGFSWKRSEIASVRVDRFGEHRVIRVLFRGRYAVDVRLVTGEQKRFLVYRPDILVAQLRAWDANIEIT